MIDEDNYLPDTYWENSDSDINSFPYIWISGNAGLSGAELQISNSACPSSSSYMYSTSSSSSSSELYSTSSSSSKLYSTSSSTNGGGGGGIGTMIIGSTFIVG